MRKVAVVGGGAAGMMAAVTAAEYGAEVVLYERNDRVGKKILSTGNGKCNFSNRDLSVGHYNGNGRKGVDSYKLEHMFRQFSVKETVLFFENAGMLVKEKRGGLYPWSEQASTVLDILRLELERRKVVLRVSAGITGIKREKGGRGFLLHPFESDGSYHAVIIACGGCAAAKTGSDGTGYRLAERLGHRIVPVVPALVQLRCKDDFFKAVAGVRCEAGIALYAEEEHTDGAETCVEGVRQRKIRSEDVRQPDGGRRGMQPPDIWEGKRRSELADMGKRAGRGVFVQEEIGELQFTDYGISGIPVFQLSRQAAYLLREGKRVTAYIDFFPSMGKQEFEAMCDMRLSRSGGKTVEEFLIGTANKKINLLMIKLAGLRPGAKTEQEGKKRLRELLYSYRELQVHISSANSFEQAQVTAGGVDMAEVTDCLSSRKVPGIYFAGEVLDVDGRCGGYNLQWAWTSGYITGKYAASGGGK